MRAIASTFRSGEASLPDLGERLDGEIAEARDELKQVVR